MSTVEPRPTGDHPPPVPPELQEIADAVRVVMGRTPEEKARRRRDLAALLAAEERALDAAEAKKKARKHTVLWAVAAAVLGVMALCAAGGGVIVAFDLWPKRIRYGGAPNVKLPAEPVPSEYAPTGPPTPPPPRVPRR